MGIKSQACSDVQVALGEEKISMTNANESLHFFEFHGMSFLMNLLLSSQQNVIKTHEEKWKLNINSTSNKKRGVDNF